MGKLEEIISKVKELTPEEKEQLKSLIVEDKTDETPTEEPEQTPEPVEEPTEATAEENTEEVAPIEETTEPAEENPGADESETTEDVPAEEEKSEEPADNPDETVSQDEEPAMEKVSEDEGPTSEQTEEPEPETSPEPSVDDDDALIMRRSTDAPAENITADDGSEIPIDNQQIIDGLNAKIAALEAENASLKSKVDGAFGYSAKPTAPGKVNPLYDDAIDNVRFRK